MKRIVPIITLSAEFATVMRAVRYRKGHMENDAEHSYQLAMVCWSANHQYNLALDDTKLIKYALVHDLVELYAGDTDAFGDKKKIVEKAENEERALRKLKKDYVQFPEILSAIETYNDKTEAESQLVYVLDKLIPEVNIRDSNDDYYISRHVTFIKWKVWLFGKINYKQLDKKIQQIVDESVKEIEENYISIFYKEE